MIINIIKKYKIIVVVVGIIISCCLIKFGTEIYKQKKYENELKDALNNDTMYDFIDENEMKAHKYAKMEVPNEYNITPLVDAYIDNINSCIENKISNIKKGFNIIEKIPIGDNMLADGLRREEEFDYIINLITEKDIDDYNLGVYKDNLIKRLKQAINNREENGRLNWYVDNDCNKIIELPYNVYMDFKYSDKKNTGVKRITKIKFLDKENQMCHIEYEMDDGTIKKEDFRVIRKTKDNNKECLITSFNGVYYDITQEAHITFGQHDYDRVKEEEERAWAEVLKRRSEYKDVRYEDRIELPQFEKYDANAHLLLHEFEDGSTALKFFATKFIKKDGKNDVICREYYLPYENLKNVEEALEMYLADKEHYDADEAFLRENNRLYNGD